MKEEILKTLDHLSIDYQSEILNYAEYLLQKQVNQEKLPEKQLKFGCMKGTFKMSDDFDEPLEDFKEYM